MARKKAPDHVLDGARVDAWRLARQHLDPEHPARRPAAVATDLVGVQAQVLSAAARSIAIRTRDGTLDATTRAVAERRLVRAWAMRGTLHLFSADDYPVIAAALRHKETWRNEAWLRYFKVTEAQMEAIIEAIAEVLDDGRPRTRTELADALVTKLGHGLEGQLRSSWGTFLKPAANRGYLVQAPTDGSRVAYVRPDRLLGKAWRVADPDESFRTVVRRYLAAYGPASVADLLRWWGSQQPGPMRALIRELGEELVEVEVDGLRGLALAADVPKIEATDPIDCGVRLLGPFDPLTIMAGLRERLIPATHLRRVSRTAGWISPVVLVGGRVAGIWSGDRAGARLRVTIDLFEPATAARKRTIAGAAERIAGTERATLTLRYGPVHATTPGPGEEA